ncbi:NAD(P)/FAD-dependent oxidoreductase [Acinetobacter guillouiae]|jgi:3-phenylpropionate/trans-cinnamate dioxygenase ferredoxin reductase subunit|uniref:FAD-dependent oxidoreductase n=1 Tax=Acinetobacter guillouiae TaxID=106649 RepID=A0A8X8KGU8_ACIGI|nr:MULTISPECIES: FAD-dependent oxidoreductase [Acinetobacter]MCF0264432.1 FAD-dependent oxidoreductase [Acinetobacter guillouiae]QLD63185.1 FAD-dependent oxidoreductase [Acinetobacter sp. MYb10]
MQRIVIVGAGQAAGWAVSTLRQHGFLGEIHVVSNEERVFYERPPLSKQVLSKEASYDSLHLFSAEQMQDFNIEWHKPAVATQVDRQQKHVVLESGQVLPYDKLLIATGSRARVPVNTWQFIPNVVTLRNVQDCERLAEILQHTQKLAVIGGGWIGLEIAATARKQGKQVHVFEYGDRLCARSVSPDVSEFLQNMHQQQGTQIHLNSKNVHLIEAGQHQVEVVNHPNASELFDCVVVGAGADIAKELGVSAGLDVKDGIVVNGFGQTSDQDIYAAGDVAIHPSLGYCIQSWANAQNQAIATAKSMLGMDTEYLDIPWLWSDQYHYNIQILGTYQPEKTKQIVLRQNAADQCSYLYLDEQNCLINMIAINDSKLVKLAKRWMQSNTVLDPKLLADPEFNVMKLKP